VAGDAARRAAQTARLGHYEETYRKSEAGWRIATLTLTRLRVVTG
jgi:hypothetical protein